MSSNSNISEPIILCKKCGYVRIFFTEDEIMPRQWKDNQVHYCEVSETFECMRCSQTIYYDRRVLSPANRRIALDQSTGLKHVCKGRSDSIEC